MLTFMAFKPCDDIPIIDIDSKTNVQAENEHSHSDLHDLCTPFCSCHCCHTHITNNCAFCSEELTFFECKSTDQPFSYLSRISFSIWDPPTI